MIEQGNDMMYITISIAVLNLQQKCWIAGAIAQMLVTLTSVEDNPSNPDIKWMWRTKKICWMFDLEQNKVSFDH